MRTHVVLLDAALPPAGGVAAMVELLNVGPTARAIILAHSDDDDAAMHALTKGAAGFLWRGISLQSLASAVAGVAEGEAAISRTLAGRLAERVRELSDGLSGMRPTEAAGVDARSGG